MNIKQMEEQTGISRASIRFYESEGLLHPKRAENGYRDYSETELEELHKILLLRRLQLSLSDIRLVQQGELHLSTALKAQLCQLDRQRQELDGAAVICRTMCQEGVDYAGLDAHRYAALFDAGTGCLTPPRQDTLSLVAHPWVRYIARALDLNLYSLLLQFLFFLFRHDLPSGLASLLLSIFGPFLLMLLIEPVLLSTLGATPAKALFSLKVRAVGGGKLSYHEALTRTLTLWARGYGFSLPVYQLLRLYFSYKQCVSETEPLSWDTEIEYTYRGHRAAAFAGWAILLLLINGTSYLMSQRLELPPNRDELTPVEFAENFNYLLERSSPEAGWLLTADGSWEKQPPDNIFYGWEDQPLPKISLHLQDGVVTGLEMSVVTTESILYSYSYNEFILAAAMALLGSDTAGALSPLSSDIYLDCGFQADGMDIARRLVYAGYFEAEGYGVIPEEGAEPYFELHFSITPAS